MTIRTTKRGAYRIGALLTLIAALTWPLEPAPAQDARATPEAATGRTAKALAEGRESMIVTANPLASEAGQAMLADGGSAADAAIAALLVLNVVEPQSAGLGGGAFALVHTPDGLTSFDAREAAPAAAGPDLFLEDGTPIGWWDGVASGRSVGVPGLGRLLEVLHSRYGRLDWARLVAPAERLAREGFAVSPRLAGMTARTAERIDGTDAGRVFLPGGRPLRIGSQLRQPALADTLARLAAEGPDILYTATIAEEIVAATRVEPRPGALTLADLSAYRVIERAPVCSAFRTVWRICGMGPPSSGATTVGQILGLMSTFPPATGADRLHLFAEASRLAYADRAAYLGDPAATPVPLRGLLDDSYLAARAGLIDPAQAASTAATAGTPPWREGQYRAPDTSPGSPGTTHLSVIDATGLAIALTASIETAFGSKRMAGGFILNNQLTDFAFTPRTASGEPRANAPGPGLRPRSSMAPTIVYASDAPDQPRILAGSPGGSRIPEYVALSLLAILEDGADAASAAAVAHASQRNRDTLVLEADAHDPATHAALKARGHKVETADMTSGLAIIVVAEDGALTGGADPRREGLAVGR
ncbi:MAG: gamma-glutamyltransferase family protein [Pseudomonadota bacterium]